MRPSRTHYRAVRGAVVVAAVGVMVFLALPTLVILPLSLNPEPYFSYPMSGLSTRWYEEVIWSDSWRGAFANSLAVALASALAATVIGTAAALGVQALPAWARVPVLAALLSPIVIPIIVFAVGFFYLSARTGMANTLSALVWGHVVLGLPFVVIVVSASLERFDPILAKAAAGLGAPPLAVFRDVVLPLIAPGVLTGAIFAFITSWDEIVLALFVAGGPENHTLPRRLWSGLREELSPAIIAVAALLTVLSIALMIAVEMLRGHLNHPPAVRRPR